MEKKQIENDSVGKVDTYSSNTEQWMISIRLRRILGAMISEGKCGS